MHKIPIIHLREGENTQLIGEKTTLTVTKNTFIYFEKQEHSAAPDLDFTHEVSELHVILEDEVCVETVGRDAVLLLYSGTVADTSTVCVLLNMSGGRGFCIA